MAGADAHGPDVTADRLPTWHTAAAARGPGRSRLDWGLIVPVPASVASHREAVFSRFGQSPALIHCLESRRSAGDITGQPVVAVAEVMAADVAAMVDSAGVSATVTPVGGAGTFRDCVAAGLARLDPGSDYVLVHDISRPLASNDLVDRILDRLRSGDRVVIPALALVDSVKAVAHDNAVTDTVDRSLLRSTQYPRGFHRRALAQLLGQVGDDLSLHQAMLVDRGGEQPAIIEGDPDAFTLTFPRDLDLAEAIHRCRLAEQR